MSRRSIDLGKIMVTLAESVWNARTSYEVLTAVYHDGDGYISRRDNIGVEPGTDDSVWYRIVKQGTIPNITFDEDGNMYADDVLVTTVFADVIERSREAVENVEQWSQVGDTMVEEEMRRRHQEDERIAAENERVLNERNRRTAEENRARNEASRESKESSREIAEVQREVRFEDAMRQAASTMRKGDPGKSAYEIAVDNGFEGTEEQWLTSLTGPAGDSAYAIAVQQGFVGTKDQWLASLVGPQGKSAYQVAVDNGFEGTISEWLLSLKGGQGIPGPAGVSSVNVTTDALSSDNPTCEASVENGVLNLAFSGLKGRPGVGFQSVSSEQDGTLVITLTDGNTVTIDLNHNHPQYYSKNVESSQPQGGFLPDVAYNLGELTGSVSFALAAAVPGQLNHYFWMFDTGLTPPDVSSWPAGITWADGLGPTIAASKHYQISIIGGIATYLVV